MRVRAIHNSGAADNHADDCPRVLAFRDRVQVKGNKPAPNDCVSLTAAAFQRTADKAANVFDFVAALLLHVVIFGLCFLRSRRDRKTLNELRPKEFSVLPLL